MNLKINYDKNKSLKNFLKKIKEKKNDNITCLDQRSCDTHNTQKAS